MGDLIVLAISCILINNILLAQYLGNCPFLGTSKKMETAIGMAMAVVFVSGDGRRHHLDYQQVFPGKIRSGLSENGGVYPGDCLVGPIRGDVFKKEYPGPVCRIGNISAADHHQLRRDGCVPDQCQ